MTYSPLSKTNVKVIEKSLRQISQLRICTELSSYADRFDLTAQQLALRISEKVPANSSRGNRPIAKQTVAAMLRNSSASHEGALRRVSKFLCEQLSIPEHYFWIDVNTVVSARHEMKRMGSEHVSRELCDLATGWIYLQSENPDYIFIAQIVRVPKSNILLTRGRIIRLIPGKPIIDISMSGYAVLTRHNLNLHMDDGLGRQYIIYCDIKASEKNLRPHPALPIIRIDKMRFIVPGFLRMDDETAPNLYREDLYATAESIAMTQGFAFPKNARPRSVKVHVNQGLIKYCRKTFPRSASKFDPPERFLVPNKNRISEVLTEELNNRKDYYNVLRLLRANIMEFIGP